MKLKDVIEDLYELGGQNTVYISNQNAWTEDSSVALVPYLVDGQDIQIPPGMEYFLEVELMKDVLEQWSCVRNGKSPSYCEKVDAILYYVQNDAYILIEEE